MRSPDGPKGAGKKRTRSDKRISRDEMMFPNFNTIEQQELKQYNNVVFVDPNLRDTLFMMHISSS